MKYSWVLIVSFFILSFTVSSCFQNTDWDQADDIIIDPVIELDLIYFDIEASQFYNETANTPNLVVRDTTAIEFIEGSDIRDVLLRAEYLFKFTNTIPRDFLINFDFLSQDNILKYASSTQVLAGSFDTPVETLFLDTLVNEQIDDLTSSNKVVVSVTIPAADAALLGTLNLQSKATYFLQID